MEDGFLENQLEDKITAFKRHSGVITGTCAWKITYQWCHWIPAAGHSTRAGSLGHTPPLLITRHSDHRQTTGKTIKAMQEAD